MIGEQRQIRFRRRKIEFLKEKIDIFGSHRQKRLSHVLKQIGFFKDKIDFAYR